MPTYEYACRECGRHLEVHQSFSDAPLTECPTCSGPLRKVFAPPGISFKGSGFYKNDSRPASAAAKPASDASTTSSDATPATKADKAADKPAEKPAVKPAAKPATTGS